MPKIIHLISDLHLTEEEHHLVALFEHYMLQIAPQSQQLYVLGDFFDVWVGDDFNNALIEKVIRLFQHYTNNGGELFIAHGNRDFLIGKAFTKKCHATLINEPFNFKWQEKQICLMHGDSLCTDDLAYQEFKSMVRTTQWQNEFLNMPIEKRLEIAGGIREQSKDAQKLKQAEIMDVNQQAVEQCFKQNHCDWLIHGHTHREAQHSVKLATGKSATRIVLADWGQQGFYVELKDQQFHSLYFDLVN